MLSWQPPGDRPSAETAWIDLLSPTEAELRQIEAHLGYRLPTLDDLSAIERSSQLVVEGQQLRFSCPEIGRAHV